MRPNDFNDLRLLKFQDALNMIHITLYHRSGMSKLITGAQRYQLSDNFLRLFSVFFLFAVFFYHKVAGKTNEIERENWLIIINK